MSKTISSDASGEKLLADLITAAQRVEALATAARSQLSLGGSSYLPASALTEAVDALLERAELTKGELSLAAGVSRRTLSRALDPATRDVIAWGTIVKLIEMAGGRVCIELP